MQTSVVDYIVMCLKNVDTDAIKKFGLQPWDISTVGLYTALHMEISASEIPTISGALCGAILLEATSARKLSKARLFATVIQKLGIAETVFETFRNNADFMYHIAQRGDMDNLKSIADELIELGVTVPNLLAEAETRYPRSATATA